MLWDAGARTIQAELMMLKDSPRLALPLQQRWTSAKVMARGDLSQGDASAGEVLIDLAKPSMRHFEAWQLVGRALVVDLAGTELSGVLGWAPELGTTPEACCCHL